MILKPITYQLKWYKYTDDGSKTPATDLDTVQVIPLSSRTHLLKFYKAKPYVSGTYQCEGWNSYGKDVKTISVNVQGKEDAFQLSTVFNFSTFQLSTV